MQATGQQYRGQRGSDQRQREGQECMDDSAAYDMSFCSVYHAQQLSIAEEKYKNLREIQSTIKSMEVPGLPIAIRTLAPRKHQRAGHGSVGRINEILNPTEGAIKYPGLLATPAKLNEIIASTPTRKPRPPASRSDPYHPRKDTSSMPELGLKQPKRLLQVGKADADYRSRLVLNKVQIKLNGDLFVPLMDTRQSKTREMARSISSQRMITKRTKKRHRTKFGTNKEHAQMLSQISILERASTVYRGWTQEKARSRPMKILGSYSSSPMPKIDRTKMTLFSNK